MANPYAVVIFLILALGVVSVSALMPDGYVGGKMLPNGDVMGGHPSEEQMAAFREEAGVSVTIDTNHNRVFSGDNWREFAVMDREE